MLKQVLREIENSTEPISLTRLSRKLNIEPGALEGMLAHWVRKGKLHDDDAEETSACHTGSLGGCGATCTVKDNCSFVARMPKSYSLPVKAKDDELTS